METKDVLAWIQGQSRRLEERLIEWSTLNSGSYHLEGLTRMSNRIAEDYRDILGDFARVPLSPQGHLGLEAHYHPEAEFGVILCGHLDTVFGPDHPFQTAAHRADDVITGPGVADMKGGLLIMLTALAAVLQTEVAKHIHWNVLINPDEEIGSPHSMPWMLRVADTQDLAFIFEPAVNPSGALASQRKGSGKFAILAHGRAAHAGRDFDSGRNAIVGLSELVLAVHQLNGQRDGVTLNIGKIEGGTALNIVPNHARVDIDVRTRIPEDEAWISQALNQIIEEFQGRQEIHYELQGKCGRPPKILTPKTERLLQVISNCAKELHQSIEWFPTGGSCDGNNFAAAGLAVIDSLGARGNHIHTDQEYIVTSSLVERAQLTALVLLELAQDQSLRCELKKGVRR